MRRSRICQCGPEGRILDEDGCVKCGYPLVAPVPAELPERTKSKPASKTAPRMVRCEGKLMTQAEYKRWWRAKPGNAARDREASRRWKRAHSGRVAA